MRQAVVVVGIVVLYLVHNDLWWWDDATLVLGLPVGLTFHVAFCFAVSLWMALAVRWAPPPVLRGESELPPGDREREQAR